MLILYVFRFPFRKTDMLDDSLSKSSLICLSLCYFFTKSEPEYAYKKKTIQNVDTRDWFPKV